MNKIRATAEHIYNSLMGFVYPPQCVICDLLHEGDRFFLCDRCAFSLDFYSDPYCFKCKNPMDVCSDKCPACGGSRLISKVWACSSYDDFFRPLIHSFKYQGIIPAGRFLSRNLADLMADRLQEKKIDMIIPVPLHPLRECKRGFNQSVYIAEELQNELHIPIDLDVLIRVRRTKDQTGLNREQRKKNMRGAFRINPKADLEKKRIILVDDVTTSGATASEAARILKEAGAREIQLAVLAIAGHDILE